MNSFRALGDIPARISIVTLWVCTKRTGRAPSSAARSA